MQTITCFASTHHPNQIRLLTIWTSYHMRLNVYLVLWINAISHEIKLFCSQMGPLICDKVVVASFWAISKNHLRHFCGDRIADQDSECFLSFGKMFSWACDECFSRIFNDIQFYLRNILNIHRNIDEWPSLQWRLYIHRLHHRLRFIENSIFLVYFFFLWIFVVNCINYP